MPTTTEPAPSKHKINMIDLETAITLAQGDASLLLLVLESMDRGDAWSLVSCAPVKGYKLFMLTDEQVRMLHHAAHRVHGSVDDAAVEFFGRELARWS